MVQTKKNKLLEILQGIRHFFRAISLNLKKNLFQF